MKGALDHDADVHEGLRDRWYRLRHDNPKLRIRDAAGLLGVSEMQLVSLGCGASATRLADHWLAMVAQFADFGDVMALTRNDFAVHELTGHYVASFGGGSNDNSLGGTERRLDLESWAFAFAVCEEGDKANRYSIQFFDHAGVAVHKVYLTDRSDRAEYAAFVSRFRAEDQRPGIEVPSEADAADPLVGLNVVSGGAVDDIASVPRRLSVNALSTLLGLAAERGLEVAIAVGSGGAMQRYVGKVKNTCFSGPWFNVLDKPFSLHLREDGIATVVVVTQTGDGCAIGLRAVDHRGEPICDLAVRDTKDRFSDHALKLALAALRDSTVGASAVAQSADHPA